jgi:predicted component of type VI protein secretion system
MITLRLFRASDPFQEVASRIVEDGSITLGRDSSSDWAIEDDRGDISRRHLTLHVSDERVTLRDHSTNGVYLGPDRRRAVRDADCSIRTGETLAFGDYILIVDSEQGEERASPVPADDTREAGLAGRDMDVSTHAGMLEAFCDGANLDPSSFIGEDPASIMVRLGAVYRQVIDDLSLLLSERAALKDRLQLDRTTISAHDNNPLKWAAPTRAAVDLLKEGNSGFLKGAEALKASFEDLRRHNVGLNASSRAAVAHVLRELAPETLEAQHRPHGLGFLSRDAIWKAYQNRHRALSLDDAGAARGEIADVSRAAYLAALTPALAGDMA